MTKYKLFVLAIFSFVTISIYSQTSFKRFSFIPRVGINFANLTNNSVYVDVNSTTHEKKSKPIVGLNVGLDAEYRLNSTLGLSLGAFYSVQGYKWDIDNFDRNQTIHYFQFPLMANVYITKGFYARAGVQYGLKGYVSGDWVPNDPYKNYDISIPIGIGYEYNRFLGEVKYNIGITDISESGLLDSKNSVFTINIGYRL